MNLSRFIGRSAKNYFFATGYLCRSSQHQHGREQRSRAAGNVQTDFLDGNRFLPAGHSRNSLYFLSFKTLRSMEGMNILLCKHNGRFQFNGNIFFCLRHLRFGHSQGIKFHFIKPFFIFNDGFISFRFYTVKHFLHGIAKRFGMEGRTTEHIRPFCFVGIYNFLHILYFFKRGNTSSGPTIISSSLWAIPKFLPHPMLSAFR